jgi:hypothetical protein
MIKKKKVDNIFFNMAQKTAKVSLVILSALVIYTAPAVLKVAIGPSCRGGACAERVLEAAVQPFDHAIRLRVVSGRLAMGDA